MSSVDDLIRADIAGLKTFTLPPRHSSSPESSKVAANSHTVNSNPVHATQHADPVAPGIAVAAPSRITFAAKKINPPAPPSPSTSNTTTTGAPPPTRPLSPESHHSGSTIPKKFNRSLSPMAGTSVKRSSSRGAVSPGPRTSTNSVGPSATMLRRTAVPVPTTTSTTVAVPVERLTSRVQPSTAKRNPSELEMAKNEVEALRTALREAEERAQEDAALVKSLEEERMDLDAQLSHSQHQVVKLEEELRERDHEVRKEMLAKENALREITVRDATITELKRKLEHAAVENELAIKSANARIASITEAANARMSEFETYITKQSQREQSLSTELSKREERITMLESLLRDKESEFKHVMLQGELQRSELHNRIQEMKGNIRVYARVRPLVSHDREFRKSRTIEAYQFPDRVDHKTLCLSITGKDYTFEFDKVFEPCDTQDRVFEEISQLVQSALDGYKVCIFVYGQTGSGKTYTMEGSEDSPGVIPRAVERIFRHSLEKKRLGWNYSLKSTFVEIYNENIHDLLNPAEYAKGASAAGQVKHEIRIIDDETFITNVEEVPVEDADTVHRLLKISQSNRKCESTLMNDRASRSHSVFTLKIRGVNEGSAQVQQGVLNLVDLAGSERINKSGVEGERLRETQCINKSLTSLGDVISALAKGDASHVPYRNSKLTHMLQPYMGGDSKTLMFVNISPSETHVNESLCSLRFAAKVNSCEIGLAMRKVQSVGNLTKR
eukprot:PhF_6_TR41332/c1_g2_i1/m.62675/K10405/KIFC1; kinesin family member C1